jgi:acyl-CoA hydrolase
MEVGVKVFAEDILTGERQHTSSAYVTFVALDEQGRPKAVAPLICETEDERRRFREAGVRRQLRLAHRYKTVAT